MDNTVFCNFAAIRRMDLLEVVLDGRGRVTEAVHEEMLASSAVLPGLVAAVGATWLRAPVQVVAGRTNVQRLRRDIFGGVSRGAQQHLGEAESCHLLTEDPGFEGGWWLSDDRDSLDYASDEGIVARETVDVMAEAVRERAVAVDDAMGLMRAMGDAGRHPRQPTSIQELMRPRLW